MSLSATIARLSTGAGGKDVDRELRNLQRDMDRRKWEYQMQKESNDYRAAATSGLIGSTLGIAKGAYGAYQDREHEKSVNDAVAARRHFKDGPEGTRAYYDSIHKNYPRGVFEDTYFRQSLPQAGSVDEYLRRQGVLSQETKADTPSWYDAFADIAAGFPSFGS